MEDYQNKMCERFLTLPDWSNVESSKQCNIQGDFEPDCDVDVIDVGYLLSFWLMEPCDNSAGDESDWCYGADLSQDGIVNIEDFAILTENFLTGCP